MKDRRAQPVQLDLLDWLAAQDACPDAPADRADPGPAPAAPVVLTRVEPACNMRRFYSVALATSLFGEPGVERAWGRIGSPGRRRADWFAEPEAARAELERMAGAKRRRGYQG
ncbi:WGR domain-containing protein [Rubellimicrobium aerolatum]|uniref:WGR domain-containing protein n=1 Tax=Rubellimicrobium aerolatum TaxID=490979 RepID=A0ABW0SGW1_9RHOB|nr:WGR domain-containing protein [Rubellimicrobium aerolatum]MBP1807628.1 putative DNA-binding WGR domain protein [Rubellimicrobium aerolatum]